LSEESPIVVLTNDDGIDAPGIVALERVVEEIGLGPYRVIAPSGPCSGCGHQVTTHGPIEYQVRDPRHVAVGGTPADCVRLALQTLAPDVRLVLSGINPGGNLGTDVFHSGTVAAVREAGLYGVPGIALSHYIARGRAIDWDRATRLSVGVIRSLLERPSTVGFFWNVNLPHPPNLDDAPELVDSPVDPSPLPLNYRIEGSKASYTGDYQGRARIEGSDVSVCFGGSIAISSVPLVGSEWRVAESGSERRLIDLLKDANGRSAPGFHLVGARRVTS
jgi:5'-nucleotidase